MGNVAKYLRKIYFTVALTFPLFSAITLCIEEVTKGFSWNIGIFFFSYILFAIYSFICGLFVILVMYIILKMTENVSEIYIRKMILNGIIVLLLGGCFILLARDNYRYYRSYKFYELLGWSLPITLTLTAAIWYFKLEPKEIPELTETDHLVE